jgi:hypothetical protein
MLMSMVGIGPTIPLRMDFKSIAFSNPPHAQMRDKGIEPL